MNLKKASSVSIVIGSALAVGVAQTASAAIDLSEITGAFTSADVVAGVLAIGGVLAVIYASVKAAKLALGMIRGG